jgi:hypothetical protein
MLKNSDYRQMIIDDTLSVALLTSYNNGSDRTINSILVPAAAAARYTLSPLQSTVYVSEPSENRSDVSTFPLDDACRLVSRHIPI